MRRAVIRSSSGRRVAMAAVVVLLLVAALTCSVRIARLWTTTPAAGGGGYHTAKLEHGRLVFETTTSMKPATQTQPTLNWQVEFGISIDYEQRLQNVAVPGGMVTTRSRAIPIALPLIVAGGVLVLLCLPLVRVKRGGCVACDYDLTGLDAEVCPECGTAIARATSSS